MAERKYGAACMKFAASQRLEEGIGVSLWLADCLENNGQTASAWEQFERAATLAAKRSDPRELVARTRAAKLLAHLSRVIVVRSNPSDDFEIDCDGVPISPARWAGGFYADPGLHHVRALARGSAFWEGDVDVGITDVQTITVPGPPHPPTPIAQPVPTPTLESPRTTPPHRTQNGWTAPRIAALATTGAGLVGIGLGAYFGLLAKSDNDASQGGCGPQFCSQAAHDLRASAAREATVADVALGLGAAASVAGVLLFVLLSPGKSDPVVLVGPRGVTFKGGF
jgi:hypothetical protein